MKNIIEEYGSAVLGAVGAVIVLGTVILMFTDGGSVADRLLALLNNAF